MKIGLLSDTHGFLDEKVLNYFADCDEIWHAGDIGDGVAHRLSAEKNFKAVFGNIDGKEIRAHYPEFMEIEISNCRILITHIAGIPPRYTPVVRSRIKSYKPHVLICGHSHITRVSKDDKNQLLYLNPGAAGQHGFHQIRTIMKFEVSDGRIKELVVIELGKRGKISTNEYEE
jgi:putative phosphoesterase